MEIKLEDYLVNKFDEDQDGFLNWEELKETFKWMDSDEYDVAVEEAKAEAKVRAEAKAKAEVEARAE